MTDSRRFPWGMGAAAACGVCLVLLASVGTVPDAAAGRKAGPLVPMDRRLANGLSLRVLEDHELPVVSVALQVPAGAAWDPPGKGGVADLTGRLLLEGTRKRSAVELGAALEGLGATLDVETASDTTTLRVDLLSRDLATGLGLLAEIVLAPAFEEESFQQQREMALADLRDTLADPFGVTGRVLYAALYGDHPYGRPDSGTLVSLAAIGPADPAAFHAQRYRPEGSVLAVVGDVVPSRVESLVSGAFRSWKGAPEGMALPALPAPWKDAQYVLADLPGQTQAQIRVATRTISRNHPDRAALEVANSVLGDGFTSRLMEEVRVNRSLSYGASSRMPSFAQEGFLVAGTYTRNASVREALDVVTSVVEDWRAGGIAQEHWDRARHYQVGMVPLEVETCRGRVDALLDMAYHDLPRTWMADRVGVFGGLTLDQGKEAVRRHVPAEGWLVVVVGDLAEVRPVLDAGGPMGWRQVLVE